MKNTSKLACLFSLGLLSGLCMMVSINVTNGAGFNIDLNKFQGKLADTTHISRLKTLYLGGGKNAPWMTSSSDSLDIFKGLVVDNGTRASDMGNAESIVIGGGQGNRMSSDANKSGIAGGSGNKITQGSAAIGGGSSNLVQSVNGVVAGGNLNRVEGSNGGGVVLGGDSNVSEAGVVLGGQGNEIGKNGLAMGKKALGGNGSFVRNDGTFNGTASDGSAVIGTKNGVLIGTYTPIEGVSLVVSGAVKIGTSDGNAVAGEIRSESDGCLYAYDGTKWYILGKNSSDSCINHNANLAVTCGFGRVLLQEGNEVTAYSVPYHDKCDDTVKSTKVVCTNVGGGIGKLVATDKGNSIEYVYPSCHKTSSEPYYIN